MGRLERNKEGLKTMLEEKNKKDKIKVAEICKLKNEEEEKIRKKKL